MKRSLAISEWKKATIFHFREFQKKTDRFFVFFVIWMEGKEAEPRSSEQEVTVGVDQRRKLLQSILRYGRQKGLSVVVS